MCVRTAGRSLAMARRPPCTGAAQVLDRAVWVGWCRQRSWPLARITLDFFLASAVPTQTTRPKVSWCLGLPLRTGGDVVLLVEPVSPASAGDPVTAVDSGG